MQVVSPQCKYCAQFYAQCSVYFGIMLRLQCKVQRVLLYHVIHLILFESSYFINEFAHKFVGCIT